MIYTSGVTYRETLTIVNKQLSFLKNKFGVSPGKDSWVYEAINITEELIKAEKTIPQEVYFKQGEYLYEKTLTSLAELINLKEILDALNRVDRKNLEVLLKKLKSVFDAPLLTKDETINSNESRNTMFELRLFSKLIAKDYDASLSLSHPDIFVKVNGNNYSIECKRIFKKETLIPNARVAINQLLKYSLDKPGYGIVAISVTRYFHSGDKRLEAISEKAAKKRIEYEMDAMLKEAKDELLNIFPLKIPALFLEFSDRVAADKAYTMNLIDILETANGRTSLFYKVKKDFQKLITSVDD